METGFVQSILQAFAGIVLFMTTGMASWTMKQVFRLNAEVQAVKAHCTATDMRLDESRDWMKSISAKLDRLVEKAN